MKRIALYRPLRVLALLVLFVALVACSKSKTGTTTPANKNGPTDPAKDPAGGTTYGGAKAKSGGSGDLCGGGW